MLEAGDILFLDEIHELSSAVQVCLYRAWKRANCSWLESQVHQSAPFCLIGPHRRISFDDKHEGPVKILIRLNHYSEEEMVLLIRQRAKRLGWAIDDASVGELAKRSRGVPRLGVRLLDAPNVARQPIHPT